MIDKGVRVYNGSDWPAAPTDWRKGMQISITRKTMGGLVCGEHQALNIEEALRTFTSDPAWLDYMEGTKGSIEIGMYADFAVLGEDITEIDPEKIEETPIHMSIVGGNVVYTDGTLSL